MVRPHINDLIDPTLLQDMIAGGYIRTRQHDTLPLTLYSYTEKAQYESVWNDATMQCRGLIVDAHGIVQARPLRKFFNHNQPEAGTLDLDAPVEVADKLDGSLGIGFVYDGDFIIATRGSFHSEQAKWASVHYGTFFADAFDPYEGCTYLFEIIYPQNRIVVDYAGVEDLVLLGMIDTDTGRDVPSWSHVGWPGGFAEVFPYSTLREALAAPPRDNAEGLVIRNLNTGERVKLKYSAYIALHKVVTGLTERSVWEALERDGWGEFLSVVPDEFHTWCNDVASQLEAAHFDLEVAVNTRHREICRVVDPRDRKAYAMEAAKTPELRPYLFMRLDENYDKLDSAIWKALKPSGDTYMNSGAADEVAA